MSKEFFIERTNKDYSFTVIKHFATVDDAIDYLNRINSKLHHGVWSQHHVSTVAGYAPIAWIN